MANEFVIKNGFISKGNSTISGTYLPNGYALSVTGDTNLNGDLIVTGSTIIQDGLTANTIYTDYIDFNITANTTHQEGRIHWNDTLKTLQVDTENSDVSINVGHDVIQRVVNKTGSPILKGKVVYINSEFGGRPTITLASNTSDLTSARTFGVVMDDIDNNKNGYVIAFGLLQGINTNSYTGGQTLYLGVNGNVITTKPIAPTHLVYVAKVISVGTNGSIFVSIQNGFELDELHDVRITTPLSGDLLIRSSYLGSPVWVNTKTLNGNYTISGNTSHIGNFNITGDTTQIGNITLSGNSFITGNTTQIGDYFITGDTTQIGDYHITGNTTQYGDVFLSGNGNCTLFVDGNVCIGGDLNISGNTTQSGTTNQTGDFNITGNTSQIGLHTHSGDTFVTGNTTQIGDINITGTTTQIGLHTHSGDTFVTGNTFVTGDTEQFGNLYISGDSNCTLFVDGDVCINGDLNITGDTTQIGDYHITGNTSQIGLHTHSGDTFVTGNTIQLGDSFIVGNEWLTGNTNQIGVYTHSGDTFVTGNTTQIGDINITGTSTQIGNINLSGDTFITGNTTQSGTTNQTGDFNITGNTTQIGIYTHSGDTFVTGDTEQFGNLYISGDSNCTIYVDGNVCINGNLNITGNTTQFGNINLSGNTFITGNTTQIGDYFITGDTNQIGNSVLSGNTFITGDTTQYGNVYISGTSLPNECALEIDGNVCIDGDVNITGDTFMSGDFCMNNMNSGGLPTGTNCFDTTLIPIGTTVTHQFQSESGVLAHIGDLATGEPNSRGYTYYENNITNTSFVTVGQGVFTPVIGAPTTFAPYNNLFTVTTGATTATIHKLTYNYPPASGTSSATYLKFTVSLTVQNGQNQQLTFQVRRKRGVTFTFLPIGMSITPQANNIQGITFNGISDAWINDEFQVVVKNDTGSGPSNSIRIVDLSFSMFT